MVFQFRICKISIENNIDMSNYEKYKENTLKNWTFPSQFLNKFKRHKWTSENECQRNGY